TDHICDQDDLSEGTSVRNIVKFSTVAECRQEKIHRRCVTSKNRSGAPLICGALTRRRYKETPIKLLPVVICIGHVQINQNIAWLSPFARAHNAAIFQFIHDTRGASVAQTQAALQKRNARLLLAANDLDALFDNLLVLANASVLAIQAAGRFLQLLMN